MTKEERNNRKGINIFKKNLHATMLAYLFLNLFVGFKKCWKENSSSGWTSCRTEELEQLGHYLLRGGGGKGGERRE